MVGFPPKSSILIGFSFINHPFWGTTILGTPPHHPVKFSKNKTPGWIFPASKCALKNQSLLVTFHYTTVGFPEMVSVMLGGSSQLLSNLEPPFISTISRPFGRGPTTGSLGDKNVHHGYENHLLYPGAWSSKKGFLQFTTVHGWNPANQLIR